MQNLDAIALVLSSIGTLCWIVCFWWMHRISSRQDATLEDLHEMTARIEKLSRAEHDLIRDVHPQVAKSKRRSKTLEKSFRPKEVERFDLLPRTSGFVTGYPHSQRDGALMLKFLLDYFTRLCPNTALKQT